MGKTVPLTETEKDFIRAAFPQLGVTEMARRLGRSRTAVNQVVRTEGLRARPAPEGPPAAEAEGGPPGDAPEAPEGTAGRLAELRDRLRLAMLGAEPRELAGLAREYRATIEALDRLEGGRDDDAAIAIDVIGRSIASRMPA